MPSEKWGCRIVRMPDCYWDVQSPSGKYWLNHAGWSEYHELTRRTGAVLSTNEAMRRLDVCTIPPPDFKEPPCSPKSDSSSNASAGSPSPASPRASCGCSCKRDATGDRGAETTGGESDKPKPTEDVGAFFVHTEPCPPVEYDPHIAEYKPITAEPTQPEPFDEATGPMVADLSGASAVAFTVKPGTESPTARAARHAAEQLADDWQGWTDETLVSLVKQYDASDANGCLLIVAGIIRDGECRWAVNAIITAMHRELERRAGR